MRTLDDLLWFGLLEFLRCSPAEAGCQGDLAEKAKRRELTQEKEAK